MNQLLLQIESLCTSIEEKEFQHRTLIESKDYSSLIDIEADIKQLKKQLQGLEEQFLRESFEK